MYLDACAQAHSLKEVLCLLGKAMCFIFFAVLVAAMGLYPRLYYYAKNHAWRTGPALQSKLVQVLYLMPLGMKKSGIYAKPPSKVGAAAAVAT